jgi:3-hydroxyacyl-[acyl-carrier-protein] dehydratase
MRFIMVDEIRELVPGERIVAVKTLRATEDVFNDHFPGFAVVPGVLLVEMLAQAAGKCLDVQDRSRGKAMLVGIRRAAFRRWVLPEQTIVIVAEVTASTEAAATIRGRLSVMDEVAADAELLFSFLPYSRLDPNYQDEVLEAYLTKQGANTASDEAVR